jgi:predicted metal-dependent hydrolase
MVSSSSSPIEVRPLHFAVDADVPRHWHGGRKAVTSFFDSLSVFFPPGERFFIQTVREAVARGRGHESIGERLLADVRAFCGQEGAHSREHAHYNEKLRREGYPVEALEARVEARLRRVRANAPLAVQLAITCALEHMTACMGALLLEDARVLEGAHPVMAALWRWHAAEENEHKAVAFDVYEACGGGYRRRALVMTFVCLGFWARVIEHQVRMMHTDGALLSAREWADLARFLFVRPGALARFAPLLLRYYRPGFHPSEIDSSDLVDAWRRGGVAVAAQRRDPAEA